MENNNESSSTPNRSTLNASPEAKKTLRVLVIDDDPNDSELYSQYLLNDTEYDYQLSHAETGEEGLVALKASNYDCILLDFHLPDYTGVELIDKLNAISNSRIPILMLTGAGSEDIAVEAMRAGAADYLPKRLVSADSLKLTIIMAMDKFETINAIKLKAQRLEKMNTDLQLKRDEIQRIHDSVSNKLKKPAMSIQELSSKMSGNSSSMSEQQKDTINDVLNNFQQMNDEVNNILSATQSDNDQYNVK